MGGRVPERETEISISLASGVDMVLYLGGERERDRQTDRETERQTG